MLFRSGEMLIDTIPANEVRDASNPEYNRQLIQAKHASEGIPLIPINAMAGWGTGDLQVMGHECERYVVPMLKEAEFLIPVKGESMHPTYRSGDIVGCKRLLLSDVFYQPNKVYVLDTDQGAIIKRVKPLRGSKRLLIISDNNEYEPFELREDQVHSVALVVGLIRPE